MNISEGFKRIRSIAERALFWLYILSVVISVYMIEVHKNPDGVAEQLVFVSFIGFCAWGLAIDNKRVHTTRICQILTVCSPIYWLFLFGSFYSNRVYFSWPMYWLGFTTIVLIFWLCLETFSYIAEGFLQKK